MYEIYHKMVHREHPRIILGSKRVPIFKYKVNIQDIVTKSYMLDHF